jgi:hypothetical protein
MKHPDAAAGGLTVEFKTVTGNIRRTAGNVKAAGEKPENVFLKIDPPLSRPEFPAPLLLPLISYLLSLISYSPNFANGGLLRPPSAVPV